MSVAITGIFATRLKFKFFHVISRILFCDYSWIGSTGLIIAVDGEDEAPLARIEVEYNLEQIQPQSRQDYLKQTAKLFVNRFESF